MVASFRNHRTGCDLCSATETVGVASISVFTAGGFFRVSDFGAADVVVGVLGNGLGFGFTADCTGEGLNSGIFACGSRGDLTRIPGVCMNGDLSID